MYAPAVADNVMAMQTKQWPSRHNLQEETTPRRNMEGHRGSNRRVCFQGDRWRGRIPAKQPGCRREGPDGRLRGNLHIVTDISRFKRFDDEFQAGTHYMELDDGKRCKGVAEVFLVDIRGRHLKTMLRRALYIPSYPQDIFSVQAAASSGASVTFRKSEDILVHKKQIS
ncbi:hypothetical protein F2P79_019887 [Pimephales promelas]|nr:hypothetical protein F2P79_019887 [Pimephales promelas]